MTIQLKLPKPLMTTKTFNIKKTPLPCPISFQTSSANTDWVLWLRCYDYGP